MSIFATKLYGSTKFTKLPTLPACVMGHGVAGAMDWVNTLQWEGMALYHSRNRQILRDPDTDEIEMFVKASGQLKFYWILDSGHVVGGCIKADIYSKKKRTFLTV